MTETLIIVGLWTFSALRPVEATPAGELRHFIKAPTATEKMIFEFREDGTERLRWDLLDEGKFCERTSTYVWQNNELTSTVTALHEGNDPSCGADPEMVVGQTTTTPARIENNQLILTLPVSTDRAELVFDRNPEWCPKVLAEEESCG
ncbi:MAG: hypothetical protein KF767_17865 [Bdellovibrionaceae bacterium]|nr:hypothetical protein [Pseudobdellovibrionaceae bacterium]